MIEKAKFKLGEELFQAISPEYTIDGSYALPCRIIRVDCCIKFLQSYYGEEPEYSFSYMVEYTESPADADSFVKEEQLLRTQDECQEYLKTELAGKIKRTEDRLCDYKRAIGELDE